MSEDLFLKVREEFAISASGYTKERSSHNNSFGGIIKADGKPRTYGRYVCHGWMCGRSFRDFAGRSKVSHILSAVMFPWVSEPDLLRFIDWLINRSPWAAIFVDKDPERVRKLGYLVDANHSPSFIASAMVASRFITEVYSGNTWELRCKMWLEFLEMGCSENEAFLFAHLYNPYDKGRMYPVKFSVLQSGHSTFFGRNFDKSYLRNFLEGVVVNEDEGLMSNGVGYSHINFVWGSQSNNNTFPESLMNLVPKRAVKAKDLHIFRAAPKDGYTYVSRDDLKSVVDQLREIIYA